tara:strand:- start:323 stop:541 length:219 start_codon:yes stop_codon:yes gene_type:complete
MIENLFMNENILNDYSVRELQIMSGKILSEHSISASNSQIKKFKADHDSVQFYKNVIMWYIELYEEFPDEYL